MNLFKHWQAKILAFSLFMLLSQAFFADESKSNVEHPTKILVSVVPYALILKELGISGIEISVLQEASVNPHTFQMKPSHLKKIAEADLVIWGGEHLEPYLVKALSNTKRQIVLAQIPEISLLRDEHEDDHNLDPHIWLSGRNSQAITKAMKKALEHNVSTEQRASNTGMINEKLGSTHEVKQKPLLLVHHNAYAYLETELGFKHDYVIFDNHNAKPGLKHWHELNKILQNAKAQERAICIISSPAFFQSVEARKLQNVIRETGLEKQASWKTIDPMASDKKYESFSSYLAESKQTMLECMNK